MPEIETPTDAKGRALTETRRGDRLKLACRLSEICLAAGAIRADVELESDNPDHLLHYRRTRVLIETERGLKVTAEFRARSPHPIADTHVLSWHVDLDSDAALADVFGHDAVNKVHFHKATQVACGFVELAEKVVDIITKARDGRAFSAERERANIAKHGAAADRKARFDAAFAAQVERFEAATSPEVLTVGISTDMTSSSS